MSWKITDWNLKFEHILYAQCLCPALNGLKLTLELSWQHNDVNTYFTGCQRISRNLEVSWKSLTGTWKLSILYMPSVKLTLELYIIATQWRQCLFYALSAYLSKLGCFSVNHSMELEIWAYRKIPKISPGAYIFQRPFLRGLFIGRAYVRREICFWKSARLILGGKFASKNRFG